jgi:purine-binding chemotaxis protein CheW
MGKSVQEGKEMPAVTAETHQYLTFNLAGEMFAVGTLTVKEIIEYGHLTTVPMMPSFVRGVINLRGAVVPVIDLGVRFGKLRIEITRRTCIVILEVTAAEEKHVLGVVVDAVSEVLEIPANEIEPPPAFGAKIRADFIQGMGKVAGKFVILLDVGKVLSVDEIVALATASEEVEQRTANA